VRITIEIDGGPSPSVTTTGTVGPDGGRSGGPAPAPGLGSHTGQDSPTPAEHGLGHGIDTGSPPPWLIAALTAAGASTGLADQAHDGGSAPDLNT
jgi:hypothetical protein